MNFDLFESAKKKCLLVAHRGVWGGNIPCNTIPAYEAALADGADVIEIDIDRTADGQLVVFHPGKEDAFLGFGEKLGHMPWDFVKQLRYINIDNDPTQFGIHTLDEVLDQFRGRCYINTDKFWNYPKEISESIRARGMQDQVIVKTAVRDKLLDIIEEYCPDMQYLPIIRREEELEQVKARKLRLVGAEVLFANDTHPFATEEFIDKMHQSGLLVWVNAIVYNYREVLAGGHSDDRAFLGDPEGSWGWLCDRGYDFIQTDHMLRLSNFLEKTGRLYR